MASATTLLCHLARLCERRAALIKRLAEAMEAERRDKLAERIASEYPASPEEEAAVAADEFCFRALNGNVVQPSTSIERLLAEIYEIDGKIFELMDGETPSHDELH